MKADRTALSAEAVPSIAACLDRIQKLEALLAESKEMLDAIRRGDVDAVVVEDPATGPHVYTLESADHPYRIMIEQIQEGALTLGDNGLVLYCNRRLAELLGVPHERVIGQSLRPFVGPDDLRTFDQLLLRARRGHTRCRMTIRRDDGKTIPVLLSLSPLPGDGARRLLCGVMADLTEQGLHVQALSAANARLVAADNEREAVEETLRQSQKMEAVGQLTGGLAHDFNNLLAVIMGNLEMMQGDLAQARAARLGEHLRMAMAAAARGAAITRRLLAFSQGKTLDPKLVSPNRLVDGMADLLRRTVGSTMTVEIALADDVGSVICDPHQLENVLLNLTLNARDAMGQGGRLLIATQSHWIGEAFAAPRQIQAGRYVNVSVTDTGAGMPPEVLARAFDPFFTTKPVGQGTGLGLSMIYRFTRESGGLARIESKVGVGTTVSIHLPCVVDVDASAAVASPPAGRRDAAAGATVLVVEDEPDLRALLIRVLRRFGYATIDAADGTTGLEEVSADQRIDLLVTDLGLPGDISGTQLADRARVLRPGLRVLFMTGQTGSGFAGEGFHPSESDVIAKPFTIDAFATKIRSMTQTGDVTPDGDARQQP